MPRIKHIMKGREVIDAWMRQSQDYARTPSGSVAFCGTRIARDVTNLDGSIEDRTVDAEVVVMPNGETVYFVYSNIIYRTHTVHGYSMTKMLSDYVEDKPNHTMYVCESYRCAKPYLRMCGWNCWLSSYTTFSRLEYVLRKFMLAKSYIQRWRVAAPTVNDTTEANDINLLFDSKVVLEDVVKRLFDDSFDNRKLTYDSEHGNGSFISRVRGIFRTLCDEYGVQMAGGEPFESDGSTIKLSVPPRVGRVKN